MTFKHCAKDDVQALETFTLSSWLRLSSVTQMGALATWDMKKKGKLSVGADHHASDETSVRGKYDFDTNLLTMGLRHKLTSKLHVLFTGFVNTKSSEKMGIGYSVNYTN